MFFKKAWAFLKRDMIEAFSYKVAFFFDLVGMVANILTFFFIAQLIGPAVVPQLQGYGGYFPFVLIGIALAQFQSAAMNSFAGAIQKEQGHGTLEAILITPTSLAVIAFSGALWDLFFVFLKMVAYLAIGAIFFGIDLSRLNILAAVLILILTVTSLAGFGFFSAGFVLVFKRGDPINYFMNGFSRFLSGVYFPISVLPFWVQKCSWLIPWTYSLEAMRMALLEGKSVFELANPIISLILFSILFLPSGLLFFRWSVKQAKREGSLVFY
ncbi:MAG: ABC transporter permease [Deltaproteobacteria bacterium]|nr:ABC transporter permease [Deltaproteobacteria bacterium]